MCLGVSLAVLTPTLSLLSGLYEKFINTNDRQQSTIDFNSVGKSGLFLLSHLTNHGKTMFDFKLWSQFIYCTIFRDYTMIGYYLRWNSRATSVLIGMWCLTTIVLANAYAGTLFSFLSVAKLQPIINSLDELANST